MKNYASSFHVSGLLLAVSEFNLFIDKKVKIGYRCKNDIFIDYYTIFYTGRIFYIRDAMTATTARENIETVMELAELGLGAVLQHIAWLPEKSTFVSYVWDICSVAEQYPAIFKSDAMLVAISSAISSFTLMVLSTLIISLIHFSCPAASVKAQGLRVQGPSLVK